ncbi:hypothetical protein MMC28_008525, partial [Mycoblastus sanguinarius]|nr:hypothetical protein [Mycoblastus sanguinarius]
MSGFGDVPSALTLPNGAIITLGGSAIAASGTTYAFPSDINTLIINGKQTAVSETAALTLGNGAVITYGDSSFVLSGTTYSLPTNDIGIVVDGKTMPYSASTATGAIGIGGLILSGLGSGPVPTVVGGNGS